MSFLTTGPGGYPERPPQYDQLDGQDPPGRYFDDSMGPPNMGSQQHMDGYPDDGRRTPSNAGGSKHPFLRINSSYSTFCSNFLYLIDLHTILFHHKT